MSLDSKYFAAADSEINAIRMRNEFLFRQRRGEIFDKFPDIAEMDRKLSATSAKLIRLICDEKEDFSAKLKQLEEENIKLQELIKNELVKNGYPDSYLDMPYSCRKCNDTGVFGGKRCSCYMDMVRAAAMRDLNSSSALRLCTFGEFKLEYYDDKAQTPVGVTARRLMADNLDFCVRYADNFHLPYKGILMKGQTGLGKTHLSLSIAEVVIRRGYSVIYGSAPDLFRKIEKEHFGANRDEDTMDALQRADLLVLDDVGAEFESKFYASAMYDLVNNRMNASLPTVMSTNLAFPEIKARYGDRVASRLMTMEQLVFFGTDVRRIINAM